MDVGLVAGTEWECYLGQAAVDQKIIGGGSASSPRRPASASAS